MLIFHAGMGQSGTLLLRMMMMMIQSLTMDGANDTQTHIHTSSSTLHTPHLWTLHPVRVGQLSLLLLVRWEMSGSSPSAGEGLVWYVCKLHCRSSIQALDSHPVAIQPNLAITCQP